MSEFANIQELEKRLWSAADELRANTGLTSQEYSRPVLGLIFLRYAEYRFELAKERLEAKKGSSRRRKGGNALKTAIQAEGAMYVPEAALFSNLLKLPEDTDLGKAVNDAMKALEAENEAIKDALPKTYTVFANPILAWFSPEMTDTLLRVDNPFLRGETCPEGNIPTSINKKPYC